MSWINHDSCVNVIKIFSLFCYTGSSEKKPSSTISPTELFTFMSDRDTQIIIMDVRSIADYPESWINHDDSCVNVIKIFSLFCYTESSEKKPSSTISPTEMFTLMSDRDTQIIIMDVRSIAGYQESRIYHDSCVNVIKIFSLFCYTESSEKKPSSSISPAELLLLMSNRDTQIIIMDVRSIADYQESWINHDSCVNVIKIFSLFCYTGSSEKKPSSTISPTELFTLMRDRDTQIFIMDVRPIADYQESRINHHDSCVNVIKIFSLFCYTEPSEKKPSSSISPTELLH